VELVAPLALRVRRREQERLGIWLEKLTHDGLRLRTKEDRPRVPVVLRLVPLGRVRPNGAGGVDVAAAHDHRLAGPHAAGELKPDEPLDLARRAPAPNGLLHPLLRHRPHRVGLARVTLALPQTGHRLEPVEY
jgi:hypothetical protein